MDAPIPTNNDDADAASPAAAGVSATSKMMPPPPPVNAVPSPANKTDRHAAQDMQATCDVLCSLSAAADAGVASAPHTDGIGSVATAASALRQQRQQQSTPSSTAAAPTLKRSSSNESFQSVSTTASNKSMNTFSSAATGTSTASRRCSGNKSLCPKQHQLPMFLTKTYHMIDRCDGDIATWSDNGDSFVVKNVEKFASTVLPLYFKHSNFSSFARQLNFYGFRKLRSDPILTTDVDPRTACYVRFYHEKFQKDRPELLHHIKRATKSDPHTTKDDMDTLKSEVTKYQQTLQLVTQEFDHKLQTMREEYNRKLVTLTTEYDQLATLVHQLLAHHQVIQQQLATQAAVAATAAAATNNNTPATPTASAPAPDTSPTPAPVPAATPAQATLPMLLPGAPNAASAAALGVPSLGFPNLLSHLSQVASMNLQQGVAGAPSRSSLTAASLGAPAAQAPTGLPSAGTKRPSEVSVGSVAAVPASTKRRQNGESSTLTNIVQSMTGDARTPK